MLYHKDCYLDNVILPEKKEIISSLKILQRLTKGKSESG